jgi:hypothetical protein
VARPVARSPSAEHAGGDHRPSGRPLGRMRGRTPHWDERRSGEGVVRTDRPDGGRAIISAVDGDRLPARSASSTRHKLVAACSGCRKAMASGARTPVPSFAPPGCVRSFPGRGIGHPPGRLAPAAKPLSRCRHARATPQPVASAGATVAAPESSATTAVPSRASISAGFSRPARESPVPLCSLRRETESPLQAPPPPAG